MTLGILGATNKVVNTLEAEPHYENTHSSDDRALLQCAASGDAEAFGHLVREHHAAVISQIIAIVRDRDLADEVCQDTFLAAYQSLGDFRFQCKFSTWLISIARNKSVSALRSKLARLQREKSVFEARVTHWSLSAANQSDGEDLDDSIDHLQRCLGRLDPQQREVIERFYGGQESAEAIGRETGRSGSGIRMMLLRLRKILHRCMQTEISSS